MSVSGPATRDKSRILERILSGKNPLSKNKVGQEPGISKEELEEKILHCVDAMKNKDENIDIDSAVKICTKSVTDEFANHENNKNLPLSEQEGYYKDEVEDEDERNYKKSTVFRSSLKAGGKSRKIRNKKHKKTRKNKKRTTKRKHSNKKSKQTKSKK